MGLAVLEAALEPAAVGIVQTSRTLEQAIDHLTAVAAAIGQDGIGWQQGLGLATGGQQQGQAERGQMVEVHGSYPG